MSQVHYTIEQVWALKPQFTEMVGNIIDRLMNVPDWRNVDFKETFTVDGNKFEFIFKTAGLATLLEQETLAKDFTAVTATTFIGGRPNAISVAFSDYTEKEPVSLNTLDRITELFIATVVANMARRWYFNDGMHERVMQYINNQDMSGLTEHVDEGLYCWYNDKGYCLSYITKAGERVYAVETLNTLKAEDPNNTYKTQFERHLHDLIVVLLASGHIWTDIHWSKPLN